MSAPKLLDLFCGAGGAGAGYMHAGFDVTGVDIEPHPQRAARTLEEGQRAMGIDWMVWDDLIEAIPPVYTEHIGTQLLAAIEVAA